MPKTLRQIRAEMEARKATPEEISASFERKLGLSPDGFDERYGKGNWEHMTPSRAKSALKSNLEWEYGPWLKKNARETPAELLEPGVMQRLNREVFSPLKGYSPSVQPPLDLQAQNLQEQADKDRIAAMPNPAGLTPEQLRSGKWAVVRPGEKLSDVKTPNEQFIPDHVLEWSQPAETVAALGSGLAGAGVGAAKVLAGAQNRLNRTVLESLGGNTALLSSAGEKEFDEAVSVFNSFKEGIDKDWMKNGDELLSQNWHETREGLANLAVELFALKPPGISTENFAEKLYRAAGDAFNTGQKIPGAAVFGTVGFLHQLSTRPVDTVRRYPVDTLMTLIPLAAGAKKIGLAGKLSGHLPTITKGVRLFQQSRPGKVASYLTPNEGTVFRGVGAGMLLGDLMLGGVNIGPEVGALLGVASKPMLRGIWSMMPPTLKERVVARAVAMRQATSDKAAARHAKEAPQMDAVAHMGDEAEAAINLRGDQFRAHAAAGDVVVDGVPPRQPVVTPPPPRKRPPAPDLDGPVIGPDHDTAAGLRATASRAEQVAQREREAAMATTARKAEGQPGSPERLREEVDVQRYIADELVKEKAAKKKAAKKKANAEFKEKMLNDKDSIAAEVERRRKAPRPVDVKAWTSAHTAKELGRILREKKIPGRSKARTAKARAELLAASGVKPPNPSPRTVAAKAMRSEPELLGDAALDAAKKAAKIPDIVPVVDRASWSKARKHLAWLEKEGTAATGELKQVFRREWRRQKDDLVKMDRGTSLESKRRRVAADKVKAEASAKRKAARDDLVDEWVASGVSTSQMRQMVQARGLDPAKIRTRKLLSENLADAGVKPPKPKKPAAKKERPQGRKVQDEPGLSEDYKAQMERVRSVERAKRERVKEIIVEGTRDPTVDLSDKMRGSRFRRELSAKARRQASREYDEQIARMKERAEALRTGEKVKSRGGPQPVAPKKKRPLLIRVKDPDSLTRAEAMIEELRNERIRSVDAEHAATIDKEIASQKAAIERWRSRRVVEPDPPPENSGLGFLFHDRNPYTEHAYKRDASPSARVYKRPDGKVEVWTIEDDGTAAAGFDDLDQANTAWQTEEGWLPAETKHGSAVVRIAKEVAREVNRHSPKGAEPLQWESVVARYADVIGFGASVLAGKAMQGSFAAFLEKKLSLKPGTGNNIFKTLQKAMGRVASESFQEGGSQTALIFRNNEYFHLGDLLMEFVEKKSRTNEGRKLLAQFKDDAIRVQFAAFARKANKSVPFLQAQKAIESYLPKGEGLPKPSNQVAWNNALTETLLTSDRALPQAWPHLENLIERLRSKDYRMALAKRYEVPIGKVERLLKDLEARGYVSVEEAFKVQDFQRQAAQWLGVPENAPILTPLQGQVMVTPEMGRLLRAKQFVAAADATVTMLGPKAKGNVSKNSPGAHIRNGISNMMTSAFTEGVDPITVVFKAKKAVDKWRAARSDKLKGLERDFWEALGESKQLEADMISSDRKVLPLEHAEEWGPIATSRVGIGWRRYRKVMEEAWKLGDSAFKLSFARDDMRRILDQVHDLQGGEHVYVGTGKNRVQVKRYGDKFSVDGGKTLLPEGLELYRHLTPAAFERAAALFVNYNDVGLILEKMKVQPILSFGNAFAIYNAKSMSYKKGGMMRTMLGAPDNLLGDTNSAKVAARQAGIAGDLWAKRMVLMGAAHAGKQEKELARIIGRHGMTLEREHHNPLMRWTMALNGALAVESGVAAARAAFVLKAKVAEMQLGKNLANASKDRSDSGIKAHRRLQRLVKRQASNDILTPRDLADVMFAGKHLGHQLSSSLSGLATGNLNPKNFKGSLAVLFGSDVVGLVKAAQAATEHGTKPEVMSAMFLALTNIGWKSAVKSKMERKYLRALKKGWNEAVQQSDPQAVQE